MTDANYYAINGKILASVASSDLTVAVTDYDGSNFSALNPMVYKIFDTPRVLDGALSITLADATNWFNAGGAELATRLVNYFVYLGWRASDTSIFILLSRIPGGRTYADFSATSTNEKYGAYSGSAPASTDPVVNIGRFSATLSAGAGYTWSISGTGSVVNHPIFESENLIYSPQWTSTGTQPAIVNGTLSGRYKIKHNRCLVHGQMSAGASTTFGTGTYLFSSPFTNLNDVTVPGFGAIYDSSTDTIYVANANFNANVNTIRIRAHATAGLISGTVPITLAVSDIIYFSGDPALL